MSRGKCARYYEEPEEPCNVSIIPSGPRVAPGAPYAIRAGVRGFTRTSARGIPEHLALRGVAAPFLLPTPLAL